jgi:hypothetical protein
MFFCSRRFMGNDVCCVRFTARGQVRSLRAGFGLSAISLSAFWVSFSIFRGGKIRLPGHLAADNAERADERNSVRVDIGLVGRFAHEAPYSVVSKEQAPDLLLDHFRFPGAEGHSLPALGHLQLVEHELYLVG